MSSIKHVVSISGGKDSTALWLHAIERGVDFTPVFADTGHEHEITYEYIEYLEKELGPIKRVTANFDEEIEKKRVYMEEHWVNDGVPRERVEVALQAMKPTGNVFLDCAIRHGRFPSPRRRFCSQDLKHKPIHLDVVSPLIIAGHTVVSWQGVRADESRARADLDVVEEIDSRLIVYRPLITWSVDDVFDLHRRHGIEPNPLYKMGMRRVGCMPCIMCAKGELRNMANRWPDHLEKVKKYEEIVSAVSKRGSSTFFDVRNIEKKDTRNVNHETHGVKQQARWAKTSRGGNQFQLDFEEHEQCSSIYGLCE